VGEKDPGNQLKSYTNCQIRVSTNNTQPTDDQVFLTISFGGDPAGTGSSGGSSGAGAFIAVVVGIVVVAGGAFMWLRRGRTATAAKR
jgi:hypothetical protein